MGPGLRVAAAVLAMAGTAACMSPAPVAPPSPSPAPAPAPASPSDGGVLVFTRTAGFRHDSIPAGLAALRAVAGDEGMSVTATEDPAELTSLDRYAAVVFLNTSGAVLDAGSRSALAAYVRGGGGWVGVHAAADTEDGWPFFGELVGARFARHPPIQPLTVRVDRDHPATGHLPAVWRVTDEPYDFRGRPGAGVRVLARLDEASYSGGGMGADHPITWCHRVGAGRSFYTGLGHPAELYADPGFRGLLRGGLAWAAGTAAGDCGSAS